MSQRQADNELRALGEHGWRRYEARLWRDIPGPVRIAMACVRPGAAWAAKDELLEPSRLHAAQAGVGVCVCGAVSRCGCLADGLCLHTEHAH